MYISPVLFLQGLEEATKSAEKVGINTTIILLIVLALISGFSIILIWLLKHISQKDKDLLRVIEERREDLMVMRDSIGHTADAVKEGSRELRIAFSDFSREMRDITRGLNK